MIIYCARKVLVLEGISQTFEMGNGEHRARVAMLQWDISHINSASFGQY